MIKWALKLYLKDWVKKISKTVSRATDMTYKEQK